MSPRSSNADDTSSGADANDLFTVEDVPESPAGFTWFDGPNPGPSDDIVDGEIVDESKSRLKSEREAPLDKPAPKSGPPALNEWMDFFSRIVIRMATDFYIDMAFRDIDEAWLTESEVERIKLTKAERDRMAQPFAELSNKLKFTRKHGRTIIAASGTLDAVLQIGMWVSRVGRIRNRVYERMERQVPQPSRFQPPAPRMEPSENVSAQPHPASGTSSNGQGKWRPTIAGTVFNPDAG